jgi:hypothetical protein
MHLKRVFVAHAARLYLLPQTKSVAQTAMNPIHQQRGFVANVEKP